MTDLEKIKQAFPVHGWKKIDKNFIHESNDNDILQEVDHIRITDTGFALIWDDPLNQDFLASEEFFSIEEIVEELKTRSSFLGIGI